MKLKLTYYCTFYDPYPSNYPWGLRTYWTSTFVPGQPPVPQMGTRAHPKVTEIKVDPETGSCTEYFEELHDDVKRSLLRLETVFGDFDDEDPDDMELSEQTESWSVNGSDDGPLVGDNKSAIVGINSEGKAAIFVESTVGNMFIHFY